MKSKLIPAKEVLYDIEWQVLRSSMLTPINSWSTLKGTKDNITKLNDYLLVTKKNTQEYYRRLWRIINSLNAVRRGYYGQEKVDSREDILVVDFSEKITKEYNMLKNNGFNVGKFDWDKVLEDLKNLKQTQLEDFNMLRSIVIRPESSQKEDNIVRLELEKFITLLKEVL
jgi:hypothetical protein